MSCRNKPSKTPIHGDSTTKELEYPMVHICIRGYGRLWHSTDRKGQYGL